MPTAYSASLWQANVAAQPVSADEKRLLVTGLTPEGKM